MSPTPEHFEKLEAYLDGALGAEATGQVKRELEADPQMRAMMLELSALREWVGGLPRAAAPADLIESFQGQLERTALLGESVTEEADGIMRIDRWSNVMSIAAILLLAAGLLLLIYKVLPDKHSNEIAVIRPPSSGEAVVQGPESGNAEDRQPSTPLSDANSVKDARADRIKVFGSATTTPAFIGSGGGGGAGKPGDSTASTAVPDPSGARGMTMDSTRFAASASQPTNLEVLKGTIDKMDIATKSASPNRTLVTAEEIREMQQRIARSGNPSGPDQPLDVKANFEKERIRGVGDENTDEPIVLLVKSQDPRQAMQDVNEFLLKNNVVYVASAVEFGRKSGGAIEAIEGAQIGPVVSKQEVLSSAQGMNRAGNSGIAGGLANNYVSNATTNTSNGGFNNYSNSEKSSQNQISQSPGNAPYQNKVATQAEIANNSSPTTSNGNVTYGQLTLQPTTSQAGNNINSLALENGGRAYDLSKASPVPGNGVGGGGYARANTYRAMLTNRQESELNDFICSRGNQWAERQRDLPLAAGEKAKAAEDPISMYKKASIADAETRLKIPSVTTEPAAVALSGAAAKTSDTAGGRAETSNLGASLNDKFAPAPTPALRAREANDRLESKTDLKPAAGSEKNEVHPAPAEAPLRKRSVAAEASDTPHEVTIVISDQAVVLPTALPGFAPMTRPAAVEAKPASTSPTTTPSAATQPAAKQ
jgi:hypothetical protein